MNDVVIAAAARTPIGAFNGGLSTVSAHYLVGHSGRIVTLVDERKRAWHAGAGLWGGSRDVNSRSIGIEIANPGDEPFPARQMQAVEALLASVMKRWRIRPEAIIAHSDSAIGRKLDPGPRFDWRRLALQGLSVWPNCGKLENGDRTRFIAAAVEFGYQHPDAYSGCDYFADLLNAVRLRFRPWACGPLDNLDMAIMMDLAGRFPYAPQ